MKRKGKLNWNWKEELKHLRQVFIPLNKHEKYRYLGSVPWNEEGDIFKAMEPLIIYMDYKAKPWWCPRWFLRFLHWYGNDNSIVRVRNRFLHNLYMRLTRGYMIWDYKTKWTWYDLRISVAGDDVCHDLAQAIESKFYNDGKRQDLVDDIKRLDPNTIYHSGFSTQSLQEELDRLEEVKETT